MELVKIQDGNLHYRYLDSGAVRNFLFINPLGSDFRIWDEIIPLMKIHGNLIFYDKRGHGLSDFVSPKHGLEDYAEDAKVLLEKLSINKTIAIGLSVGGQIATILASRYPALAEKLVLCDTAQKIGTGETWNQRIKTVRQQGLATISGEIIKRWFSPSFREQYPAKVAGYKNMLERCQPDAYIRACESIRDTDLSNLMRQIKLPVLCLVGEGDLSTTPADVQHMSSMIQDARFHVIPGSGHVPCVDNAEIFSKLIIDFIK